MAPKRKVCCARCAQWSKESQTIRLARCAHNLCRLCLATICVRTVCAAASPSTSNNVTPKAKLKGDKDDDDETFMGVLCSACSEEIPLDAVQKVLPSSSFQRYLKMWKATRADCVSCLNVEPKSQVSVMTCGHFYCSACMRRMCRLALGDRALVPLRCCQKEIPMDYVKEALPAASDYALYERFLREKDWKASDLESDAEYARVVQLAGGKQCPGCGIGVQRDFGCVHIKCPNGHEFCFSCLRVWQTCRCPLIPDAELEQILDD
ncbi:hypothetical protein Gpo141_00003424 [Globisporangium polare]